jgi:hypothetical protein
MNTLFNIDNLDPEYKDLYNDIVKFSTILVVVNLFMFLSNPSRNTFLGGNYIKFMTFIIMGIITYWLVISKIIKFD